VEADLQTQIEQGNAMQQGVESILHYLPDHLATTCNIYKDAAVSVGQQRDRTTTTKIV